MIEFIDYNSTNVTEVVENNVEYNGAVTGYVNESNSALDLAATILSDILLFLLVFGMSATVNIKSMRQQMRNYKALGCGIFLQFFILPFLGYITIKIFNISEVSGITLLVIVSSPGGSYSNWWCSVFNAELALSIAMTTISTIISIAFLPFNLFVYSKAAYSDNESVKQINYVSLFISIIIVISAVSGGLYCSAKIKHPKAHKMANLGGNISGICLIIFSALIALLSGDENEESVADFDPLHPEHPQTYYATAIPCVFGLILANVFTTSLRLDKPERVTCSVECCYQNTGIATAVAISMFKGSDVSEAVKVPLWYGIVEAVLLGIYLIIAWKLNWTKAPSNEKFCIVIAKSYEVCQSEDHCVNNNNDSYRISNENDSCESGSSFCTDKEVSDVEDTTAYSKTKDEEEKDIIENKKVRVSISINKDLDGIEVEHCNSIDEEKVNNENDFNDIERDKESNNINTNKDLERIRVNDLKIFMLDTIM